LLVFCCHTPAGNRSELYDAGWSFCFFFVLIHEWEIVIFYVLFALALIKGFAQIRVGFDANYWGGNAQLFFCSSGIRCSVVDKKCLGNVR
jgi:hypothetical protein